MKRNFGLILAALFLVEINFSYAKKLELTVQGMTCPSCAGEITKALEKIGPIFNAKVEVEKLVFRFEIDDAKKLDALFTDEKIKKLVLTEAGFQVTKVTRL